LVGWVGGAGGEGAWVPFFDWDSALIFSVVVVVIWVALFVRGVIGVVKTRVLVPSFGPTPAKDVTVFVPARDEAEVIERSIGALIAEPVASVVVVDDRSTDGTGALLAAMSSPKLKIIEGVGPQPGECGKPAALVHAWSIVQPSTEWLLFLDADVILERGAVASLLEAGRDFDLVSVIPRVTMSSAIEKLVMPSIGALILAANNGKPFANGQVILIRRTLYEKLGTHLVVVSEILEDVRLAEHAASAGGRLLLADGRKLATTHMYSGWQQIVEGWSRNLYLLTGGQKISAYRWLLFTTTLAWLGPIAAILDPTSGLPAWAAIATMQAILRALGGAPAAYAPLAPISALLVDHILLRSLRLHEKKHRIPWKGREY
jgi:hypothetical protein